MTFSYLVELGWNICNTFIRFRSPYSTIHVICQFGEVFILHGDNSVFTIHCDMMCMLTHPKSKSFMIE